MMKFNHIRRVTLNDFADWIENYTFQLWLTQFDTERGFYKPDRARRTGAKDAPHRITIDGQYYLGTEPATAEVPGELPSESRREFIRHTLIQFDLLRLDGEHTEIVSHCQENPPGLVEYFNTLQSEIEKRWPVRPETRAMLLPASEALQAAQAAQPVNSIADNLAGSVNYWRKDNGQTVINGTVNPGYKAVIGNSIALVPDATPTAAAPAGLGGYDFVGSFSHTTTGGASNATLPDGRDVVAFDRNKYTPEQISTALNVLALPVNGTQAPERNAQVESDAPQASLAWQQIRDDLLDRFADDSNKQTIVKMYFDDETSPTIANAAHLESGRIDNILSDWRKLYGLPKRSKLRQMKRQKS